jgi:hypothetical protein
MPGALGDDATSLSLTLVPGALGHGEVVSHRPPGRHAPSTGQWLALLLDIVLVLDDWQSSSGVVGRGKPLSQSLAEGWVCARAFCGPSMCSGTEWRHMSPLTRNHRAHGAT